MSVLLEFAMFPTDKGESVSHYVSRLLEVIRDSGATYELTPMGTVIETETMDEALAMIKTCYDQLEPDCNRIYSSLKFDIRKGKPGRMKKKMQSILDKIGEV
ncbi:MTH1187 family thiamine-binding protein [Saccharicrinis sp. FJH54]|uniref:MTH1187 family thiamine-binding protein n=1 Tax=Saccharicrinis sp. FJH54 TaxID=3344665 RepID=UPI0035D3EA74